MTWRWRWDTSYSLQCFLRMPLSPPGTTSSKLQFSILTPPLPEPHLCFVPSELFSPPNVWYTRMWPPWGQGRLSLVATIVVPTQSSAWPSVDVPLTREWLSRCTNRHLKWQGSHAGNHRGFPQMTCVSCICVSQQEKGRFCCHLGSCKETGLSLPSTHLWKPYHVARSIRSTDINLNLFRTASKMKRFGKQASNLQNLEDNNFKTKCYF